MLSEMIEKIAAESGLEPVDVMQKIEEKKAEMSNLISEEGAAYMVAKELGVNIARTAERLNISSILPGMQNVDVVGKITKTLPVREFSSDRSSGKVMNVFLADSTGSARLSLWNDEIDKFVFQEGDTVHFRGYAKADNMGGVELRLGRYGAIALSGEKIEDVSSVKRSAERTAIAQFKEGMFCEIRACVMQIFESNLFYEICPQCETRVKADESLNFVCASHGVVEPDYNIIISCVLDDGTDNIRAVFFGEIAEQLIGMKKRDAKKLHDIKGVQALIEKIPIGRDLILTGKVKRNAMFDRLEFIVNNVKKIDVMKEIEMLL
ncbi:MAG: DUF2240 family protein [Candidatus Aenigmarchaeota archaeon]|nr:DUF2240 family protein [Candidatus Aenigmarchaeota archaeon]